MEREAYERGPSGGDNVPSLLPQLSVFGFYHPGLHQPPFLSLPLFLILKTTA